MTMDRIEKEKEFHNHRFEKDTREPLNKYYTIMQTTSSLYNEKLFKDCKGKRILEYGCGLGSAAFELARRGASVHGIDISDFAIKKAVEAVEAEGLSDRISFQVMNAEQLNFEDNYFDVVCGTAILHHLNLPQALSELHRVLKNNGKGIFLEPLGHNIFINAYRFLTPKLRTEDEHPLREQDLKLMKKYFPAINLNFFHLTTFFVLPLRNTFLFKPSLNFFSSLDNLLFSIEKLKYQAWQVVIEMIKQD